MRIRLTPQDRERLAVPEWLEYDTSRPKLSEVRALRECGFKGWADLEKHLASDDMDDNLAGQAAIVWLAVRRHVDVSWDDFDFDLFGVEFKGEVESPNSEAPDGASTNS